jgi:septal ring factor EnvC (AmiA/AmiB activator)
MSDIYNTLDEATAALASTAERAAVLIRTESARAREEANRTRREIDDIRGEIRAAKAEFAAVREAVQKHVAERDHIRRSANWAWSGVGLMAVCIVVAVGWTAVQLTRGHDTVGHLTAQLDRLSQEVADRDAQMAVLRNQLEQARLAEARLAAERELRLATFNTLITQAQAPAEFPEVSSTPALPTLWPFAGNWSTDWLTVSQ